MRKFVAATLIALGLTTMASAQEFTRFPTGVDYLNTNFYTELTSKSYKVEGKPDIEGFFLALAAGLGPGFNDIKRTQTDIKEGNYFSLDKKNGYISYSEEGSGSLHMQCCYWNTKSKQKMVGLYYDSHDFYQPEGGKEQIANCSFLAFFLYNEDTKTLEYIEPPMKETLEMPKEETKEEPKQEAKTSAEETEYVPPVTPIHFLCELPQKGKNIRYRFGYEGDDKNDWHTLTYNGLMFEEEEVKNKK